MVVIHPDLLFDTAYLIQTITYDMLNTTTLHFIKRYLI